MARLSSGVLTEMAPRWLTRRVVGIVLAAVALAASLGYALRPHSSTPVADAQTSLGAPTNDDPFAYLSPFMTQGWTDRIGHKPALVFAGTDSCGFCAMERWAVVKALSAFGTWSHLAMMDGMATFDLTLSRYTSPYIAFKYTSMDDLKLTRREMREMLKANPDGGTLWILAADRNTANTNIDALLGDSTSFASVQKLLRGGTRNDLTGEINAQANALTAIMCRADGMRPQSACERPIVKHAVAGLDS